MELLWVETVLWGNENSCFWNHLAGASFLVNKTGGMKVPHQETAITIREITNIEVYLHSCIQ